MKRKMRRRSGVARKRRKISRLKLKTQREWTSAITSPRSTTSLMRRERIIWEREVTKVTTKTSRSTRQGVRVTMIKNMIRMLKL